MVMTRRIELFLLQGKEKVGPQDWASIRSFPEEMLGQSQQLLKQLDRHVDLQGEMRHTHCLCWLLLALPLLFGEI